jgi:hypothetical protein
MKKTRRYLWISSRRAGGSCTKYLYYWYGTHHYFAPCDPPLLGLRRIKHILVIVAVLLPLLET